MGKKNSIAPQIFTPSFGSALLNNNNNNNSGRSLFGDDHDDEWQTRRANDDVGNHATAVAKNPVVVFNEHF